ncbi:hypothetical protein E4U55_002901 [Claviceps digitariae]|nr:hypothetical protein E4U55_002901 [Claviceps digitariae]
MTSWETFTAFNGKLNSSFVKPRFDSQGQPDYAATVSSFKQWLQSLRQTPSDYGIPFDHVSDVERLLDAFFLNALPGNPTYPTRILSDVGYPESQRKMKPIGVQFGPQKDPLLIADAPNALGFIFSVQKAGASAGDAHAGFDEYLLPLAVCYAWALHLAFLLPSTTPNPTLTNVPTETSLVYWPSRLKNTSSPPPASSPAVPAFCLGATWSGADPADAYGAGLRDDDEAEMDRWRRKTMVDRLFAGNPAAPKSAFGASLRRTLARRLNEYILGKKNHDPQATPFLNPLFASVLKIPGMPDLPGLSEYIQAMSIFIKTEGVFFPPIDPEDFISHKILSPLLMNHLYSIVDAMQAPLEDPASFLQNLQALIRFYITPHVLDPLSLQEVPLGPKSKMVVDALASTLPPLLLLAMQQKMHSLGCHLDNTYESSDAKIQEVERLYFIENNMSYTRAAELFPLFALDHGQPANPSPTTTPRDIRGLSIFPRSLGQAIWRGAFQDSFSAALLDKATLQDLQGEEYKDAVLGAPGAEGGALVQLSRGEDMDGKLGPYVQDANSVVPRTMALFAV